jgi:predicted N-acyltransferase
MKTHVYYSLADIPADTWDTLACNGSCLYDRAYLQVMEEAKLNDFQFRYVIITNAMDTPIALAIIYTITTDAAIFAPPGLRKVLSSIRKLIPSFFKFHLLECGSPINLHSPPFVAIDKALHKSIITELNNLLTKIAREKGQFFVVLRDFEAPDWDLKNHVSESGFHWVPALPNSYLDLTWQTMDDYLSAMRSPYRYHLLKHVRTQRAAGLWYELRDDFADMADILHAQYMQIYRKADECQREILNPIFYREVSQRMGSRSKVILFFQGDKVIGHALLMLDGSLLRTMYYGRTDPTKDGFYHLMLFATVETAILIGASKVEFALTNYESKLALGAYLSPIFIGIKSPWPVINFMIGFIYSKLNRISQPANRRVFRDS